MQMRGAKEPSHYHWICQNCLARWSRRPLTDYPKAYTSEPDHKNLITFGGLTGLTYQEAYKDEGFVRYAKDKSEQEEYLPPGIATFVRYCKIRVGSAGSCASTSTWQNGSSTRSSTSTRTKTKPKAKPSTRPREIHSIHSSPTQSDVDMPSLVLQVEEDDFEHVPQY